MVNPLKKIKEGEVEKPLFESLGAAGTLV